MPPRKRAQAAPKTDTETAVEPLIEDDDVEQSDSGTDGSTDPAPSDDTAPTPERSDVQAVDAPCPTCFPDGWGAPGITARGCEHGTWQREAAG